MTKPSNKDNRNADLTAEESDIVEHAKQCGLHVKKAGPHSGHKWYCFDCHAQTRDEIAGRRHHDVDHKSFDSDTAIKQHLLKIHDVHWTSGYFLEEDGV
jgi:hypothetical protein